MMRYLLLSVLSFLTIALSAQSTSLVQFDQEIIDLGKVKKGELVSNVFTFTNVSDEEVEIDIVSTCECTDAKWTSYPLRPGEKGKIEFTFDTNTKDKEEPIDIDVYFVNIDPKTGNPASVFLKYTYEWAE